MTIIGEPAPPTLEELRTRPVGRTGAQLVLRLRFELLVVTWDNAGEYFQVCGTDNQLRMILGTAGPVHSAVVFQALAAVNRWEPPAPGRGHKTWKPEQQPTGERIFGVMSHEWPLAIGQGASEAAAFKDLARIREAGEGAT